MSKFIETVVDSSASDSDDGYSAPNQYKDADAESTLRANLARKQLEIIAEQRALDNALADPW